MRVFLLLRLAVLQASRSSSLLSSCLVRHNIIREKRQQFPKRSSAMAMLVLFVGRNLREPLAQLGNVENRIISESAISSRRFQNFPVHTRRDNRLRSPALRQRNCAHKVSGALPSVKVTQLAQQFRIPLRAARARPCVSRREDSRRSSERGHYQSRI